MVSTQVGHKPVHQTKRMIYVSFLFIQFGGRSLVASGMQVQGDERDNHAGQPRRTDC